MRRVAGISVAAVIGMGVLSGCDTGPSPDGPKAQAAIAWVEQLCSGEYAAANASTPEQFNFNRHVTAAEPDELLAQIDTEAAERLAQLDTAGVDTTPVVQVDGFGPEDPIMQDIDLSGTCFGQPFAIEDLAVSSAGESAPFVVDSIPTFEARDLFESDFGWYDDGELTIETGTHMQGDDYPWEGWVLPPGEHTVQVADHFMLAGPQEAHVTVDLFGVASPAPDFETSDVEGEEAVEEFWNACGRVCTVQTHEVISPDTRMLPVTPQPVGTADGTITFEGTGEQTAVVLAPEQKVEEWREVWPADWGQKGFVGGSMRPEEPLGYKLEVECDEGETCSVAVDDVEADANRIDSYHLSEIDGEVRVTHFYETGDSE